MPSRVETWQRNRNGKRLTSSRMLRRPVVEFLEPRLVCATVHFQVDATLDVHPISPFVYGANRSLTGAYADLNLTRMGGNRWTAYNWENNASNAGSDYQYQNDGFLGGGNVPGGAVRPTLDQAAQLGAATVVTVPINGYVSADKNGGGDVRNSGPDYLLTRFREERSTKGSAFTLNPSVADAYVYQDEFVNWVNTNYPHGQTDPSRPIMYSLDNEPDLWSSTHAEVHPAATTYAELVQKTIDYAAAIKHVAPNSKVLGPVNYGWHGFATLQDAPDRNGRDFHTFYLQQMALAQANAGHRLIDALDVHWYPEAQGGGIRITEDNNTAAVVAARLQAPRSLWDPTYTETSWITQWSTQGPIRLLPRMQAKIDQYYPGTSISLTEYNYGGGNHISGGIAQADVLGILGREEVYAAAQWPLQSSEPFVGAAFQMFLNYDGNHSTFGDTSIHAVTDDNALSSVYASVDSGDSNEMTIVAINKTAQPLTVVMNLKGVVPLASAELFRLSGTQSVPTNQGTLTIGDPTNFTYFIPAYSVDTIRIVGRQSDPLGDFSGDGVLNCTDVDSLVAAIASSNYVPQMDLNSDFVVNTVDLTRWLDLAGAANLPSQNSYLQGDANLDGSVDGSDFGVWNTHKFTSSPAWCSGDFNADGQVDGSDFGVWNANKFSSSGDRSKSAPQTVAIAFSQMANDVLPRSQSNRRQAHLRQWVWH